ncbi:two-component regulator propeller domain-containing protein [Tunturibacter empetritectus]|uniref:Two-component regulator propeller domain-containing protein n=1 Tax=Tunturiibacter empetritectus TaxID=3069691 RepID=A0AAU7ZDB9_9BACT
MKLVGALLIACAQAWLIPSSAWPLDPTRHISQYAHTAWRLQDGFLSGTPSGFTQTSDGYLWIGTQGALFRFDGVRFVQWTPPSGQKLPSENILSLAPDKDGGLWIGTGRGLAHWTGREVVNFGPIARINSVVTDDDGNAWFTRSRTQDNLGPLCEAVGSALHCHGVADGLASPNAGPLAQDTAGNLWLGLTDAFARWRPEASTTFRVNALAAAKGLSGVEAIAIAANGLTWVGMNRSGPGLGLQHLVNGRLKDPVLPGFDSSKLKVAELFTDRAGDLWVGTLDEGIYRIHGDQIDHYDSSAGLTGDGINGFFEDREGDIWVATTSGIDCFRDLPVATFSKREGLSSDQASSVLAARDGTVWVGTVGSLDFMRDGHVSSILPHHGLPGQQVTSMLQDHLGNLWVGVDNSLFIYSNSHFTPVLDLEGKPTGVVQFLTESEDHTVWASPVRTAHLYRIVGFRNGRAFQELDAAQTLNSYHLSAAAGGGLWLLLPSGFTRYRDGQIDAVIQKQTASIGHVTDISEDGPDSLWLATPAGLAAWRQGTLRFLTERNGLPCSAIYAMVRDAHRSLWLYSHCGLVRIENAELERWWAHPETAIETLTLDVFSGAQPAGSTFAPRASRSPDGRLWFSNDSVVQMVDPDHLNLNQHMPPVHIEQVIAHDTLYSVGGQLRLPPHTRDIQIDYTALSFVSPQRVQFRIKLEGHDPDWRDVGPRRSAFYTNLSPGTYTFIVRASNNAGVWNDQGDVLRFVIIPTWYQTLWFPALIVLLAVSLGYTLYLLRVRQYAAAVRIRFNDRLEERTRIARDLHDTLLQTIQGSKLVVDGARDSLPDHNRTWNALNLVSEWLGRATLEGRTALESLRATEFSDLTASLRCVVEEFRASHDIEFLLSLDAVEREMNPVARDEVYLIAFEAIRNACNHSGAKRITVELVSRQDLTLHICDDGRGIPETVLQKGKAGHFGLKGIRERASRLGAKLQIASTPKAGTDISLIVPGKTIFTPQNKSTNQFWRR